MPYKTFKEGEKWCVYKMQPDGSKGENRGCSDTEEMAAAHARAMYAHESKEFTDETLNLLKEIAEDDKPDKPERAKAVLDEWTERTKEIPEDCDCEGEPDCKCEEDKEVMTSGFVQVLPQEPLPTVTTDTTFAGDGYAVINVGEPIITEDKPKETPKKKDLLGKLKEIADAITSWFKGDEPEDKSGMTIWKEGNTYRWLARYSNKFRDRDNPPEIISSDSHKRFEKMVKEGKAPLPELWDWHKKSWKVGTAYAVAYDDVGFAVATGAFDVGKEKVAEALMNTKEPIKVSHGMPYSSIKRDPVDPSIIIEHETREISFLPAWAAANKLTGFVVLNLESKEESMAIPDETKSEWNKKLGINPETLESLEAANAADADKAVSEGLESKETEVVQPAPQPEPTPEPVKSAVDEELISAVKEAINGIVTPLTERINALEAQLTQVKEASDKRDEVLKGTPTSSLSALLGSFATSAIGAQENKVDGRTQLAQSKPKETAASVEGRTGIPFIDKMLANQ